MSAGYSLDVQTDLDLEQVLRQVHAIMGYEVPIKRRKFLFDARTYIWDFFPAGGPGHLPTARELRPVRPGYIAKQLGIHRDLSIDFTLDGTIDMGLDDQRILYLQTALTLLEQLPGDAIYIDTRSGVLLFYRKAGKLYVNEDSSIWMDEELALFPQPYEMKDFTGIY